MIKLAQNLNAFWQKRVSEYTLLHFQLTNWCRNNESEK